MDKKSFNEDDLFDDMVTSFDEKNYEEKKNNKYIENKEENSLFIGNLSWWSNESDLDDILSGAGITDILEIKIFENKQNGLSKGFAKVTVQSSFSLSLIKEKLPKVLLHGKKPEVKLTTLENKKKFDDDFEERLAKKRKMTKEGLTFTSSQNNNISQTNYFQSRVNQTERMMVPDNLMSVQPQVHAFEDLIKTNNFQQNSSFSNLQNLPQSIISMQPLQINNAQINRNQIFKPEQLNNYNQIPPINISQFNIQQNIQLINNTLPRFNQPINIQQSFNSSMNMQQYIGIQSIMSGHFKNNEPEKTINTLSQTRIIMQQPNVQPLRIQMINTNKLNNFPPNILSQPPVHMNDMQLRSNQGAPIQLIRIPINMTGDLNNQHSQNLFPLSLNNDHSGLGPPSSLHQINLIRPIISNQDNYKQQQLNLINPSFTQSNINIHDKRIINKNMSLPPPIMQSSKIGLSLPILPVVKEIAEFPLVPIPLTLEPMLGKEEFEQVFATNRTIAEKALDHALDNADNSLINKSIETLITALMLMEQSKIGNTKQCCNLKAPLQDLLHDLQNNLYKPRKNRSKSISPSIPSKNEKIKNYHHSVDNKINKSLSRSIHSSRYSRKRESKHEIYKDLKNIDKLSKSRNSKNSSNIETGKKECRKSRTNREKSYEDINRRKENNYREKRKYDRFSKSSDKLKERKGSKNKSQDSMRNRDFRNESQNREHSFEKLNLYNTRERKIFREPSIEFDLHRSELERRHSPMHNRYKEDLFHNRFKPFDRHRSPYSPISSEISNIKRHFMEEREQLFKFEKIRRSLTPPSKILLPDVRSYLNDNRIALHHFDDKNIFKRHDQFQNLSYEKLIDERCLNTHPYLSPIQTEVLRPLTEDNIDLMRAPRRFKESPFEENQRLFGISSTFKN